jgi:hypothetical protein
MLLSCRPTTNDEEARSGKIQILSNIRTPAGIVAVEGLGTHVDAEWSRELPLSTRYESTKQPELRFRVLLTEGGVLQLDLASV